MTPEQMNIVIAEACAEELAWRKIDPQFEDFCVCSWASPDGSFRISRPDYLTDANATLTLIDFLKKSGWTCDVYFRSSGRAEIMLRRGMALVQIGRAHV